MDKVQLQSRVNEEFTRHFTEPRRPYKDVKFLGVVWKERDSPGFMEEARQLEELFRQTYNFGSSIFEIPTENCQSELKDAIFQLVQEFGHAGSLLIVHYGGHGDPTPPGNGYRSVWAAKDIGGPTINWSAIQPELMNAGADVLLILDCCFAGQATRSRRLVQLQPAYGFSVKTPSPQAAQLRYRNHSNAIEYHVPDEMGHDAPSLGPKTRIPYSRVRNRVEILMACGKKARTPVPGPKSFTTALIQVLSSHHPIETTELVRRLSAQEAELFESPTHVTVQTRPLNRAIQLAPQPPKPPTSTSPIKESSIHVKIYTGTRLDQNLLHAIIAWLKENTPSEVSGIQVDAIHETLHGTITQQHRASFSQADPEARVPQLSKLSPNLLGDLAISNGLGARIAILFFSSLLFTFRRLGLQCSDLLRKLERIWTILPSPASATWFQNVHISVSVQNLQSKVTFNFPWITRSSPATKLDCEISQDVDQSTDTALANAKRHSLDLAPFLEFITYEKDSMSGKTQKLHCKQVQNIAEALQGSNAAEFRALPCLGWNHEPSEHRHVLMFQAPQGFIVPPVTLHQLIKDEFKPKPTLDQRYDIAWQIGKALQQWHLAGWVHRGISSRNIFFFCRTTMSDPDFEAPYLSGFKHSRSEGFSGRRRVPDLVSHSRSSLDFPIDVSPPYNKLDDLYSYGLLLLELGLWQLFPATVSQRTKLKMKTDQMRQILIESAQTELGFRMGNDYRDSTIRCLEGQFGLTNDDGIDFGLEKAFGSSVLNPIAPHKARLRQRQWA